MPSVGFLVLFENATFDSTLQQQAIAYVTRGPFHVEVAAAARSEAGHFTLLPPCELYTAKLGRPFGPLAFPGPLDRNWENWDVLFVPARSLDGVECAREWARAQSGAAYDFKNAIVSPIRHKTGDDAIGHAVSSVAELLLSRRAASLEQPAAPVPLFCSEAAVLILQAACPLNGQLADLVPSNVTPAQLHRDLLRWGAETVSPQAIVCAQPQAPPAPPPPPGEVAACTAHTARRFF